MPTSGTGFCGLEWRPLADGRLLVVACEHPDNPGRSVANAAEDIAGQFAEAAAVDVSRLVGVDRDRADWPSAVSEVARWPFTTDRAGEQAPAADRH